VNAYNKAVKEANQSVNTFNQVNTMVNNGRSQVLKDWQDAEKRFADDHMPRYIKRECRPVMGFLIEVFPILSK